MWNEILVIFCSVIAIVILFYRSGRGYADLKVFLSISLVSVIVNFISLPALPVAEADIDGWSKITGITFILVVLARLIRQLKPVYSRYPAPFTFTPLIILGFYPLITDTEILKVLLNQILQGGALFITFLLYFTLIRRIQRPLIFLFGIVLMMLVYGIYWFGSELVMAGPWLHHLLMALGVIVISYSTVDIIEVLKTGYQEPVE